MLNKKVQPISGKWYTDNKIPGSPTSAANEQSKRCDDEDAKMDSNYSLLDEDEKKRSNRGHSPGRINTRET